LRQNPLKLNQVVFPVKIPHKRHSFGRQPYYPFAGRDVDLIDVQAAQAWDILRALPQRKQFYQQARESVFQVGAQSLSSVMLRDARKYQAVLFAYAGAIEVFYQPGACGFVQLLHVFNVYRKIFLQKRRIFAFEKHVPFFVAYDSAIDRNYRVAAEPAAHVDGICRFILAGSRLTHN